MAGNYNLNNQQFDLNSYKTNEYLKSLRDPAKLYAATEASMEQKEVAQAENALKNSQFGALTLSEKIGIGPRVLAQLGDTALGVVREVVDPITEYLEGFEKTPEAIDSELQSYGKQMFFANIAMGAEDDKNPVGRRFVYNM